MAKTVFLQYTIHLTDPALVASLQGEIHDGGAMGAVIMAPDDAAEKWDAPILRPKPYDFTAPSITSDYIDTGDHFPTDQKKFDRKSGGLFGIPILFGTTTHYYWRGLFAYSPPAVPTIDGAAVVAPAPIAQRRWIDGFEGDTATGHLSRAASRHPDGMGLVLASNVLVVSHLTNEQAAGLTPTQSWERFYIRIRRRPTNAMMFWRARVSGFASAGYALQLTPSGQIAINVISSADVLALQATSVAIDLDTWTRLDLLFEVGASPKFRLFLNGEEAINLSGLTVSGTHHTGSELGQAGYTNYDYVIQVDDWMCADWPATLNGQDWLNGSKMQLIRPDGWAVGNGYAGDWRVLQQVSNLQNSKQSLTNNAASTRLVVTTDAQQSVDQLEQQLGVAALLVYANTQNTGANGQLGYRINGVETIAACTPTEVGNAQADRKLLYRPSGLTTGATITPLEIVYQRPADTNATVVRRVMALAEVLGTFGKEDITPSVLSNTDPATIPVSRGVHNSPYPSTPWARQGTPPQSPVVVVGGTYVGNGVGQDLVFRAPVHWLVIRNTTDASRTQTHWWSALQQAHASVNGEIAPGLVADALIDPAYHAATGEDVLQAQYLVRIPGAHADINQNGVTYQYVAFCDPGARFLLSDVLWDGLSWTAGTRDTRLINADFLPDGGFFFHDMVGSGSTANIHYKGPGSAATAVKLLTGADLSPALAWAAGILTLQAGTAWVSSTMRAIAAALFRKDDGSGDPGVPRTVQIFSYVGDGAASRTVAFGSPSGRRPLFAFVMPHTGSTAAFFRDPSHTAATSTQLPSSSNTSTGITGGGIDSISVGTAINANGVTYDVFLFPGDTVAGNNGWSQNGEFIPVEPATPVDGGWDEPPEDPDFIVGEGEGGEGGEGGLTPPSGTDYSSGCIASTTKLANLALSRLGVSLQLTNVGTDNNTEATLARLHLDDAIEATLRRYPWPFATKYASLTLVAGSEAAPVNRDWTYQYTAPADMLFARRIPKSTGEKRAWDPTPVRFRSTGDYIYTDEATPVLEYTVRPSCAAGVRDALWRDALAWQLAARIAPALARDEKKVQTCLQMFEHTIAQAQVVAANEAQPDPQPGEADWISGRE